MLRHNKKRNAFIIYEQLITVASNLVASNRMNEAKYVISLVKKHYSTSTVLGKELKLFETIFKNKQSSKEQAFSLIEETLKQVGSTSLTEIEKSQNSLLKDINENVSPDLYNIPIKDYKTMASIQILFNEARNNYKDTLPAERAKINNALIERICQPLAEQEEPIDNFTYKVLVKKYNDTYYKLVNEDQKDILKGLALYRINNDLKQFSTLVESKIQIIQKALSEKKHYEGINEAYQQVIDTKYDFSNEEHIYEIMRFLDLVEDLQNV